MKKKILVVEQNEDILYVITHILESAGYQVSVSSTEEGVLERIKEEKPDAVLLDIIRPTIEGMALCKAVKGLKSVAVIVLSTYIDINAYLKVCADDVVSKPFDIPELLTVIEKHLE